MEIELLKNYASEIGFDRLGLTTADPPNDVARYHAWVARGDAADMWYLTDPQRIAKRGDLQKILPGARSVIVGAISYAPESPQHATDAKIARYAWGQDYHHFVQKRLEKLAAYLQQRATEPFEYRTYVDTGPILERSLAERAGVGWIGKNTCVIDERHGSYLYLGELITTIALPPDRPALNRCGSCTRCLDACPTNALVTPYRLKSDLCISYQTIENRKGEIPASVRQQLRGWVAGCDICQEVCPWNHAPQLGQVKEISPLPHTRFSLKEATQLTQERFEAHFRPTSLRRIGWRAFLRNARAALGNSG